jgi:hypothetical protein
VWSFVARFSNPASASEMVEHLRSLRFPLGDRVSVRDNAAGDVTVGADIHRWDLRVVLDMVGRYGGRMVSTQRHAPPAHG